MEIYIEGMDERKGNSDVRVKCDVTSFEMACMKGDNKPKSGKEKEKGRN